VARKYATDPIKDMAGYERSVARIRSLLAPADSVFEFGCGTGTTALKLAPHVARILATDISNEMISIAREKSAAAACSNADFVVADGDRLPAADGAFDAVLALNVFHLLPNRGQALSEVRRILRPGGLFISKTPCLAEMNPLIRLALPVARALGKAPHVEIFSAGVLEDGIATAGFTISEAVRHGSKRQDPRIFIVARNPD
jgi:ubiquinone/menaquinone biosynthesis C-methylase UbiE